MIEAAEKKRWNGLSARGAGSKVSRSSTEMVSSRLGSARHGDRGPVGDHQLMAGAVSFELVLGEGSAWMSNERVRCQIMASRRGGAINDRQVF